MATYIHPTAIVEDGAILEQGTKIWHFCHVRSGAWIGKDVSIGRDCYIDSKVHIDEGSRIQNGVSIYNGVILEKSVFVGPHVVFTNDMYPRAGAKKWDVSETVLKTGCALGAGAIVRCGIVLGAFSIIGAGALVTKDIPPFTLATGFPARPQKRICACGRHRTDLLDPEWAPVRECCHEYLSANVVKLAEQSIE